MTLNGKNNKKNIINSAGVYFLIHTKADETQKNSQAEWGEYRVKMFNLRNAQ